MARLNIKDRRRKKVRLKQKERLKIIKRYEKYIPDITILGLKARFIKDNLVFKSTKASQNGIKNCFKSAIKYKYIEYKFRPYIKHKLEADITLVPYACVETVEFNL